MIIQRGERVIVTDYAGKQLKRIVWEDTGKGVLLTTAREFERVLREGGDPICVGFPRADLIEGLN